MCEIETYRLQHNIINASIMVLSMQCRNTNELVTGEVKQI